MASTSTLTEVNSHTDGLYVSKTSDGHANQDKIQ